MKKLLVYLFLLIPFATMAQNFKEDGGKYEVYCDILNAEPSSYSGGSYSITIENNEYIIVNKDGDKIKPKKDSEILTLLSKRGWVLVSCYCNPYNKLHFIMKKEVFKDDEIKEGLEKKK